jgi:uncharacterized protein
MSRDEIINSLRKYKKEYNSKYGIKAMGIFGSFAREEENQSSDLDIVVELDKADLFILSDIKQDIEEAFGCHVDIVRQRNEMNPLLKTRISQEAIYV